MNCFFIYNPNSGKNKVFKKIEYIKKFLFSIFKNVTVCSTSKKGDIDDIVKKHFPSINVLIIAGGDGSINEAVNAISSYNPNIILGILPFGTVNDIAHNLNIPKNLKKSLLKIKKLNYSCYDTIKINNKYGMYVVGGGLFTETSYATSQSSKKRFGRLAYVFHALKKYKEFINKKAKILLNDEIIDAYVSFFLIINSKYVGGQKIYKKNSLCDGKALFYLIKATKSKPSFTDILNIIKIFVLGVRNSKNEKIIVKEISSLKMSFESPYDFNIDGEKFTSEEAKIKIIKNGIKIIN